MQCMLCKYRVPLLLVTLPLVDGIPINGYSTGYGGNHQYSFMCTGDETHLQNCFSHQCYSSGDAGVKCHNVLDGV